ncbi:hypothetical protein [Streptomyces graminilatus]|uniref:hypothetical protein n=1 Tax=Streptomyces graminilatus TaxID=1464070 RepID=UPI000AFB09B1|nr:hypothetical protein [Streptomyces graminilatus]
MRSARSVLPPVLLSCLLLAGCSSVHVGTSTPSSTRSPGAGAPGTTPPAGSGKAIAVGAGPQKKYAVQQQPAAGSCHYRYEHGEPLEDPACTPGAISPAVTQQNLRSTICAKGGYTSKVRPSTYVTGKEKKANALAYGFTGSMRDAEYDHLISLQLGGDPNDPRNLWVEPADPGHRKGSGINNKKDPVETKLHTAVCKGQISLAAAQRAIVTDWTTALSSLHLG